MFSRRLPRPFAILRDPMILWAPMLVWWLALLPGGMSVDSLDQWGQIHSGHWNSHHPVPDTAFVWLTSLGGWTPATTSLVQTLLIAATLGWFVHVVGRELGGRRAGLVFAALLCVLPFISVFANTLWKDVPETAALLALSGLLITGCFSGEEPGRGWWVAVVLSSFAAGLLRWNGGVTAVVAAVVIAIAVRGRRRWFSAAAVAAGGLAGTGVLLLLPHVAPVTGVPKVDSMAQQLADLAHVAHDKPQTISPANRAVLEEVAPFRRWRFGGHSCDSSDPITYRVIRYEGHEAALNAHSADIARLWRFLVKKEPGEFFDGRTCRASLAWNLANPSGHNIVTVWPVISPNSFGLHQQGPKPLRVAARHVSELSEQRWVQQLFWRPALWVLLAIASALLCGLRNGRWRLLLLVLAVPLGALASYAAAPAAQDARYTYAATVICQIATVGYAATAVQRRLTRRRA